VREGKLLGRGAADSKIGVAIFSHLAVKLAEVGLPRTGEVYFLFDAEEHTGHFGGVKSFLSSAERRPDAVLIGYPGNDSFIVGARGFYRAVLTAFGTASHSGSRSRSANNAIAKMARLVTMIETRPIPIEPDPCFSFGPKASVTAIAGGSGYSQIPDTCSAHLDVRLTPSFPATEAQRWITDAAAAVDADLPTWRSTAIEYLASWPAYRLELESPLVRRFGATASAVFGRAVPPAVCGPSNIGNYLHTRGIPTIAGFGVSYGNAHGANEFARLESVAPVSRTYLDFIGSIPL
jgi:succinyl-diaminopimelate desuccinylase